MTNPATCTDYSIYYCGCGSIHGWMYGCHPHYIAVIRMLKAYGEKIKDE